MEETVDGASRSHGSPTAGVDVLVGSSNRTGRMPESARIAARRLSRSYDRYLASLWRGDACDMAFGYWLESFWGNSGPLEPDACPDAVSGGGEAGLGVRWYATDTRILGYASNRPRGCYQVPIGASPPTNPLYPVPPESLIEAS